MADKGTVIVIGSGAAGSGCARPLVRAGWRVIQVERDRWGGTCLWRGCIPKKSLYQSAATARAMRNAEQFGVVTGNVAVDWSGILAWKWHCQETYAGDQEALAAQRGIELVKGEAKFVSPSQIEVNGAMLEGDHIVVATGSLPVRLPIPGAELADVSDDALRYDTIPESLIIIGGGFIAAEMAGIFASFGTRVAMVTHGSRLLDMLDEELADVARRHLAALGVAFATGCSVERIERTDDVLSITLRDADDAARTLTAHRVLMATGRVPALAGLNLEAAGVETDGRGHLVLDQYLRTTNPRVWAAGDAVGGMMQTPVANLEGYTVATSITEGVPRHPDCSAMPIACFTVPQLASVGLTEETARAKGISVRVNKVGLGDVGAPIIEDATDGFTKLVIDDATGKVLGAQCAGPAASDIIYAAAMAIRAGLTAEQIGQTVAVHPSLAESLFYAGY